MATRVYLPSSGAAAVTPSTWNFANLVASPLTFAGVFTPISSAMTTAVGATGTTAPIDRGMLRWVYGPLAAQTISGTVQGQMRASESSGAANANLAMAVKIIQPDGTDRAVLLSEIASNSGSAPFEITALTLTNCKWYDSAEVTPMTLTSQAVTAGDYLVIEVGFRSNTTTSRNISLRYGDSGGSDLPDDSTTTTDLNPWIEFSGTISLASQDGTSSYTQSDDSVAAAGTVATVGTSSYTQDNDTVAGTGTLPIVGTSNYSQSDDTVAATGTLPIVGVSAYIQTNDSLSASGAVAIVGTSAYSQADDTLVASGTVAANGTNGQTAYTQADDTLVSTGTIPIVGSASIAQADDTSVASGGVAITGSSAYTQADDTISAQGAQGLVIASGRVSATFSTATPGAAFTVQQPAISVSVQAPAVTFSEG